MAVEGRIDADDDWFVGEDRTLRFRFVDGDTEGIESWAMTFELFPSRAAEGALPLLTSPATGFARTVSEPALAVVAIDGDDTLGLGSGQYQYVLSRTDSGARAVLAFGPAHIRSAVRA